MTPDDAQIDVLMRRYAGKAEPSSATEHLDADELNAFAEGSLPPAARSSYMSHLAACDDCRKLATQLTIAAGVARPELSAAGAVGTESLWRKLTTFFATPALRYGAFAAVLTLAVGVVFFSMRQPRQNARLIAQQEAPQQLPGSAVKPDSAAVSQPTPNASTDAFGDKRGTVQKSLDEKTYEEAAKESKAGVNPPPPKPEDLVAADKSAPFVMSKKAGEPATAPASPTYAPPPPREGQTSGGLARAGRDDREVVGPRKGGESDLDKYKVMDRSRSSDTAKDSRADDESRAARNQTVENRAQQRDSPRPSGPMLSRNQQNIEMNRSQQNTVASNATSGVIRTESEKQPAKQPEERSAGGHKFRRQGNAWVDSKYKTSMAIINIARGSDDFRALNSAARSAAEQLGGEVIVVSKGKAYRIR